MATRMLITVAFMALLVCAMTAKHRRGSTNCRQICRACWQNNRDAFACIKLREFLRDCINDCNSPGNGAFKCGTTVSDGCNECSCVNEQWACTEKACSGDCPGEEVVCVVDPCESATCPGVQNAMCVPNYCGGCNAVFYDAKTGKVVECNSCNYFCTADYKPVCGSDGKTYSNTCVMELEACNKMTEITVEHDGECEQEPSLM